MPNLIARYSRDTVNDPAYLIREGYPKLNCAEEWKKHRIRTRIALGLFVGWLPYGFLVSFLLNWLHSRVDFAFGAAVIPYALALIVLSIVVSHFHCPRCGSRFYAWGPWGMGHNGFARKCRNCGLRKWQCDGTS
jgi:uncharacterized membrane protein (DUF485 family)